MPTRARVSRRLVALALPALALGLGACEDKPQPADPAATPPPAQPAGGRVAPGAKPAEPAPGQPSTAKPDHPGAYHGDADAKDLGTITVGPWQVKITQEGAVEPGKEGHFDVDLSGSTEKPAAVRVWIGDKDAKGALKARAEGDGHEFHAHAEAPSPIPADAAFWVEIETAKGEKLTGSVALKR